MTHSPSFTCIIRSSMHTLGIHFPTPCSLGFHLKSLFKFDRRFTSELRLPNAPPNMATQKASVSLPHYSAISQTFVTVFQTMCQTSERSLQMRTLGDATFLSIPPASLLYIPILTRPWSNVCRRVSTQGMNNPVYRL